MQPSLPSHRQDPRPQGQLWCQLLVGLALQTCGWGCRGSAAVAALQVVHGKQSLAVLGSAGCYPAHLLSYVCAWIVWSVGLEGKQSMCVGVARGGGRGVL
jgi:hypothetical protein